MVRRIAIILAGLITGAGVVVICGIGYLWLHYDEHDIVFSNVRISQEDGFTRYAALSSVSDEKGIVIFPANFVSSKQYSQLARSLAIASHQPVFVAQPRLRIEPWNVRVQLLDKQNPKMQVWTYIGHSAGAAAACKASSGDKPYKIITVAGYCNKSAKRPTLSVLARHDPWINYQKHRSAALHAAGIDTSDHFFITDTHVGSKSFNEAVSLILQYVQD